MRPPTFLNLAACKGAPLDAFFPAEGAHGAYSEAQQYCAKCPVTRECLQHALDTGSDSGMWGGTTPAERRAIRRGEIAATLLGDAHGDKAGTPAGYYRERAAGLTPCDDCRDAYNARAREKRAQAKVAV